MNALDIAIKQVKAAGFSHVKIELEAQLERLDNETRYIDCIECDGSGHVSTGEEYPDGSAIQEACDYCDGEGTVEEEQNNDYSDESDCQNFINDNISQEARRAINYMEFYEDGSVDSELTFTLPVDKISYAIEVIDAFKALADVIGKGLDVDGAGMHVSVLTSGNYPSDNRLNSAGLANFQQEVSKLLPALFVAATSGNFTRPFNYRFPRISHDDKYSAIYTHRGTCIEYRLFETCYQRPEALFEYLGVIAKTLAYYKDTTKKVPSMGMAYPMYDRRSLAGLIDLPEQIRVVKKQMTLIKPDGTTISQLMAHRSIILKVTDARKKQAVEVAEIKKAYKEHKKAQRLLREQPLTEYQKDHLTYWKNEYPGNTEEWYLTRATGISFTDIDEKTYIQNNLRRSSPTLELAV